MRSLVIALASALVLAACASPSKVVSYGKDAYMVNVEDIWGVNSSGSLQIKSAEVATEYCSKMGKDMVVKQTSGLDPKFAAASSANIVFSCVEPDKKK